MKKNILFFFLTCFFVLNTSGQETAKSLLAKTENSFRKSGGLESTFVIKSYNGNVLDRTTSGVLKLDGKKFFFETPENITWFDGETQWTYLPGSDEVNITLPTEEELQEINPYMIFSQYGKEYSSELGKTKSYQGKPVKELIMTTKNKDKNIKKIAAYLDSGFLPLFILAELKDGTRMDITVNNNKTKQNFKKSVFEFPQKDYPDAEIIDLR